MTRPDYSGAGVGYRARLCRRFELTIGKHTPLVVRYHDAMGINERIAIGIPHSVRAEMLFVLVKPRYLQAVPKQCVIDIRPLYPEPGQPPSIHKESAYEQA